MAKIIDHVRALATGSDPERLAKRREIKQRLAGLEAIQQRHKAIGQQIATLNMREDTAVAAHQKVTAPAQATLERIETDITQLILAGEPVTDRLADDRAAALEVIAKANSKLEAEVSTLKKLRQQASREQMALAPQIQEISRVRGELTAVGVANPELLVERHVADQACVWATKRVNVANDEHQRATAILATQQRERKTCDVRNSRNQVVQVAEPSEHELRLEREVDYWNAEVVAAETALAEAQAERQRIRDAIVNE